jgi:hypothetical protein
MTEPAELNEPLHGGCQCGNIRFTTSALYDNSHVCHCRMCQKAFGNFFAALVGVPLDRFQWTRGRPASFRSSEHVDRGFCPDCGTPLYFSNLRNDKRIGMAIGAFDHPESIPLVFQCGMEGRLPQMDQLADLKDYGATEDEEPEEAAAIRATSRQHPDHPTERWPA